MKSGWDSPIPFIQNISYKLDEAGIRNLHRYTYLTLHHLIFFWVKNDFNYIKINIFYK